MGNGYIPSVREKTKADDHILIPRRGKETCAQSPVD